MERSVIGVVLALAGALLCAAALGAERAGSPGADRLVGTKGADRLIGKAGADLLIGGGGDDRLIGGAGRDVLRGGPGRDEFNIRAGVEIPSPGRDRIDARDGGLDEIGCGAGRDLALVDELEDGVYDCERVVTSP